jgi:hypothetical protein
MSLADALAKMTTDEKLEAMMNVLIAAQFHIFLTRENLSLDTVTKEDALRFLGEFRVAQTELDVLWRLLGQQARDMFKQVN